MIRKMVTVIGVALISLPNGGCITTMLRAAAKDMSSEQKLELAKTFMEKCRGTVQIGARGATGQLGGAASAEVNLNGSCGERGLRVGDIIAASPEP